MVYASTSLALAAVETFVHLLQPTDLVSIEGEITDQLKIQQLDVKELPARWYETRDEPLHQFGDQWIRAGADGRSRGPLGCDPGRMERPAEPGSSRLSQDHVPKAAI